MVDFLYTATKKLVVMTVHFIAAKYENNLSQKMINLPVKQRKMFTTNFCIRLILKNPFGRFCFEDSQY